ncbi:cardiolipin synthase [Ancylomarina euxinus]|uniref:Cardiolipin synthase n=1 Tax=Ancylomarina euxinus TaxID=2283627 RepID=A0A425Y7Z4_9BACT|nr:cardiolipin synthase [Ancylomarina euxinus]MCZ4693436.1 cardiolipin synthase [Ancylomarina euxinus]MUP13663.1 cardiolipin synthase [Ancylomarina euxinus]RRG24695.1 cardiolipin synthase [Ancylomarina euxinus]
MIFNWNDIWLYLFGLIGIIYTLTIVFTLIVVILENRSPQKTISWILVLILVPIIGLVSYLVFGQSYRKQKMFNLKELGDLKWLQTLSQDQKGKLEINEYLKNERIHEKKNVMTLLLNNSKALLTGHNKVNILNDGEETFTEIYRSLRKAREHIHLEYYIIEDSELASELREILLERARAGVEIRIIYDAVGSWKLSQEYINSLREAGIKIHAFLPVRFPILTSRINYRNHRKIIVIDGKTAFVGGLNFADRYKYGIPGIGIWRDTHLKIVGEAASSLQIVFLIDWYFVRQEVLLDEKYRPNFKVNELCLIQIVSSGADSDWASILQSYFSAIASAKQNVYISSPYFMPNESILMALKTAAMSGVDVRVLIPKKSDSTMTFYGTLSYIEELLEAGVKIFFYKAGFNHSKIMMVDGIISTVGTANMDIRSFEQNFEVNALVYDENITLELRTRFLEDLEQSDQIDLISWQKRSKAQKLKESMARIFAPLL